MQIMQRDISDRKSGTSTAHLFNGTVIGWFSRKKSGTSRSSSNSKTRAIYTGVSDQNWIINFYR